MRLSGRNVFIALALAVCLCAFSPLAQGSGKGGVADSDEGVAGNCTDPASTSCPVLTPVATQTLTSSAFSVTINQYLWCSRGTGSPPPQCQPASVHTPHYILQVKVSSSIATLALRSVLLNEVAVKPSYLACFDGTQALPTMCPATNPNVNVPYIVSYADGSRTRWDMPTSTPISNGQFVVLVMDDQADISPSNLLITAVDSNTHSVYSAGSLIRGIVSTPATNDTFASAINVSGNQYKATLDLSSATLDASDTPILKDCADSSATPSRSVWFRVTSITSKVVVVSTQGSDFDTIVDVVNGSPGSFTEVACNDDADTVYHGPSQVSFSASPNVAYYVQVKDYAPGSDNTLIISIGGLNPLTVAPSSITFPNTLVGQVSAPQIVDITASSAPVTFGTLTSTNKEFVFGADSCSGAILDLGDDCFLSLNFVPSASGERTGTIVLPFTSNGVASQSTIALDGVGSTINGGTVIPVTGWWWDPNLNGTGFFVEYRPPSAQNPNPGIFIGAFIYDSSGNATWIVTLPFNGVGTFTTNSLTGSLTYSGNWLRCTNGQTLTGTWKQDSCVVYAPVSITFSSSTTASMTRPDGTVINLTRFYFSANHTPQAGSPQSGWWWIDPANPTYNAGPGGTGYGIEIQGNAAFIVGYVYDGATGTPIWNLTTSGSTPMPSPTSYTGTWGLYHGVPHWCISSAVPCTPDGTYSTTSSTVTPVTINFTDATHGTMTMGNVVIPITKFSGF